MGQRMNKSYITEILPDKLIFVKTNNPIWKVVVLRRFMYIFISICPEDFPGTIFSQNLKIQISPKQKNYLWQNVA